MCDDRFYEFLIFLIALSFVHSDSYIRLSNKENNIEKISNETFIENPPEKSYRLPNDTKPMDYEIHLFTNIHNKKKEYNGKVSIHFKTLKETNEIILHSTNLTNFQINLLDLETNRSIENVNFIEDVERDFLKIKFSDPSVKKLQVGKEYLLEISYSGTISVTYTGFFMTEYENTNRNNITIAYTHFNPTRARTAFPCYDEPALKATFKIKITHGGGYSALSNMPAENIKSDGNDMKTTTFQRTPLMSTYNIGFIISNHNNITLKVDNVTHRVFFPPGSKYRGEVQLLASIRVLRLMEDYFEIPYTLPKLDHISVPAFMSNAVENWGLVLYRDLSLDFRYDDLVYVHKTKTLVHELIHQWFGNLVTLKWWNSVWLNEGFATFYAAKFLHKIYPDWRFDEYARFKYDTSWYTFMYPAITRYVEKKNDIRRNFMSAYDKGSSVLYMLENVLSEDTFRKGIVRFLKKYEFSAADEDELFECLQETIVEEKQRLFFNNDSENKIDPLIKRFMKSWTNQEGYPEVIVQRDYKTGTFTLQQKPYNSTEEYGDLKDRKWWIPISFSTASNPDFSRKINFIFPNVENITIDPKQFNRTLKSGDWLILNNQQVNLYRVKYDDRNLKLIIKALQTNPGQIHSYNKIQLIRDLTTYAGKEEISKKTLIDALSYLKNETDVIPFVEAIFSFRHLMAEEEDRNSGSNTDKTIEYLRYFISDLFKKVYSKLGRYPRYDDTILEHIIRRELKDFACNLYPTECNKDDRPETGYRRSHFKDFYW